MQLKLTGNFIDLGDSSVMQKIESLSSQISERWWYGSLLLSSINALVVFLLAIINYMKLDAASEAHKITAHQYDKLQSMCEFSSGYFLLFGGSQKDINISIQTKMTDIESKINDIKATNQFIIPRIIRFNYPNIYKIQLSLYSAIITIFVAGTIWYTTNNSLFGFMVNKQVQEKVEKVSKTEKNIDIEIRQRRDYININIEDTGTGFKNKNLVGINT